MKDKIKQRLSDLNEEYRKGQRQLLELQQQTDAVKASMLRISGAIQVLEEILQADQENGPETLEDIAAQTEPAVPAQNNEI